MQARDSLLEIANRKRREFVRYRNANFPSEIQIIKGEGCREDKDIPELSIIVPTLDGYRFGNFPKLLDQIQKQSYQRYEVIIVKGDTRQGRAINIGAALARGKILMTLDDDTQLGNENVFSNLVHALLTHPNVGMAGVSNLIPQDAPWLVRRAMKEIPRRHSTLVDEITDSDMAEHPCCAIRKPVFYKVGGENELLPRGLDPYLRHEIRQAGYRVVVIPNTWIHHLMPDSFRKLISQFFRNGKAAAFCHKFYAQWVYELSTDHEIPSKLQEDLFHRSVRYFKQMVKALFRFHFIYFLTQCGYLLGFSWGLLFSKEEDSF